MKKPITLISFYFSNVIKNVIKIYPNPARNFLSLQLPVEYIFDITITDITGRKIFEEKNTQSQSQINYTNFPKEFIS